jgi:type III secretion protein J
MKGRLRRAAVIALCMLLAACGKAELYSKLTEAQANEMIAVLQSAGIEASKADGGEAGWTLTTPSGDFARAVEVLHAQGLPREEFATLGTVFKKEGFVSSPTEERARLVYGMSQELSHTVSEIDGVIQARVHLVLPEREPLAQGTQPASASVFIKYRPGANIDAQVGKIKTLVVNSVEGLKYENVSVATFPAQPLPVVQVSRGRSGIGEVIAPVVAAVLLGLAALLGYPRFRRWRQRRAAAQARAVVVAGPREGDT